jgi:flavin-dependent dehydrogenase
MQSGMNEGKANYDVVVIGNGLAGTAASVHLARAGMRVLCVGPDLQGRQPVGESLDWSAPELLKALGLPMEQLIAEEIATYKKHVTLRLGDDRNAHYVPGEWLGERPFNVELKTLHVDRTRLNALLNEIALAAGVVMLHDSVATVETEDRRVAAVETLRGERIACGWFIDASGSAASLFPRKFNLPSRDYGPRKTAMWSYFDVKESVEGTTLYADGDKPPYMDWVWEIPVHTHQISVGYVSTGEAIKVKRQQGQSVESIFREQLALFPRLARLLHSPDTIAPNVTSFRCRVHGKVAGPNWLVMGESASMVDPMTSNGVTAALRHAAEGSRLIIESRGRKQFPLLAAAMYSRRVEGLAKFFNSGIERVIYDAPIRNYIGVLNAGDVYTVPAWSLNAIYARVKPQGVVGTLLFDCVLSLFRAAAAVLYRFCKQQEASYQAGF